MTEEEKQTYEQEQVRAVGVVSRELRRRLGSATAAGILIGWARTILAEELDDALARTWLQKILDEEAAILWSLLP